MKIETHRQWYQAAKVRLANDPAKMEANQRTLRLIVLLTFGIVALSPQLAAATPWDSTGTQILAIFTGGLTRTIAIIAVIAAGIAGIAGKLSWDWVIKIIIGITLIFGSAAIVDYIVAAAGG
jgi:type IV secretion system protein VirB2